MLSSTIQSNYIDDVREGQSSHAIHQSKEVFHIAERKLHEHPFDTVFPPRDFDSLYAAIDSESPYHPRQNT